MKKDKKKFIKEFGEEEFLSAFPVNFFFLEGEKMEISEDADSIVKLVECTKLNSTGYKCFRFYKKISKY